MIYKECKAYYQSWFLKLTFLTPASHRISLIPTQLSVSCPEVWFRLTSLPHHSVIIEGSKMCSFSWVKVYALNSRKETWTINPSDSTCVVWDIANHSLGSLWCQLVRFFTVTTGQCYPHMFMNEGGNFVSIIAGFKGVWLLRISLGGAWRCWAYDVEIHSGLI